MARDISDEERKSMPSEDFAGKGTSFPIKTPEDVHDAACSIGRAGAGNDSPDELKKNIIRIAKRKGGAFVARLPEAWKDDGDKQVSASCLAACVAASDHAFALSRKAHNSTLASEGDNAGAAEHGAAAEAHAAAAAAHRGAARQHDEMGNDGAAMHHERVAQVHDAGVASHLAACGTLEGSDAGAPRICLLIGDSAAGPDGLRRIPIALVTRGWKGKQKFSVTAEDLRTLAANFAKRKADIPLDYEHSTIYGTVGEPVPTAGWIKRIDDQPDAQGVLWGYVEYTKQGAESVAARDYKYVSPVIEWGVRDKKTGEQQGATLTSIALTKQPLFENLPSLPLVACEGWKFERGDAVESRREEKGVKITKVKAGAAGKVTLVADDSTETEMQVDGLRVVTMADVKRGSDERWDFASLPHGEGTLVASDVLRAMEVQDAVDGAVREGKIKPAQRAFYENSALADLKGFRGLVASMQANAAVDLEEHGTGADARVETRGQVEARVLHLIDEKRRADPKLDYGRAFKLVASEHPELMRRREYISQREG
jgi:phage I-like protein